MNELKKMFENWRSFLKGSMLSESLSDRTLEYDTTNAKTFLKFFVKSEGTARIALQMIQSSISDYEHLKTLSIDSEEYREKADNILKDPNAVAEDDMVNKYIIELQKIEHQIKTEYNL